MKAILCLMCVAVVAAKPWGSKYWMFDNSFEDGFFDTSLEWRPSGPSFKSYNPAVNPLPYGAYGGSSEEMIRYMLGNPNPSAPRTRTQKVEDLTRVLNSGYMDHSDEFMLRAVMNNPKSFGNPNYYIDYSGEVRFLPSTFGATGGSSGSAVTATKKK